MSSGGSTEQTIGYEYYLGMHIIACHGPIDSIEEIYADEDKALGFNAQYSSGNEQTKFVFKPALFGGYEDEGGIIGNIDVMFGDNTQGQNEYLSRFLSPLPAFRGVVSIIPNKILISSMTKYIKKWWIKCKNIPQKDWYPETADINSGSANGVHIIREVILNPNWGMGYPVSQIDDTSFRAAALICYDEGIGLSMLMSSQSTCEEFIQEVLKHINGVLITDRLTGLFKLKMVRDDYNVIDLPLFDENNIISLESYQRPGYGEIVNEVVLTFKERGAASNSTVTLQDLASVQAQGGIISQSVSYLGIDSRSNAALIGQRELKQRSTPLAKVTLNVNREGWDVEPGDPIRFSWAPYGITDMPLRVSKVNYGSILDGVITFECVEDVFGLPDTTYSDPQQSGWTNPITDPVALLSENIKLIEVPYFDFATLMTYNFVLDELGSTDTAIQAMADPGNNVAYAFELWTKLDSEPDNSYDRKVKEAFTPIAILANNISEIDEIDIELYTYGLAVFSENFRCLYAYIDDEIVRIDTLTPESGTNPAKITIGRGCLDTVPTKHLAGAKIWFAQNHSAWDPSEYQETTSLDCKLLSVTSIGTFDLASATAEQIGPLVARQNLPYPPANVLQGPSLVNFPANIYGPNATDANWVDRNRLQQVTEDGILDYFDAGITVEPGVTYTLRFLGEMDYDNDPFTGASKEITGLSSGATYSWSTESTDAALGSYSPQRQDHDLIMAFGDDEIGGTLSDETNVPASAGITYDSIFGAATFAPGWADIGNWVSSASFSIVFLFNPDDTDTGDDYQLLISKPYMSGSGGEDGIAIYWRRTDRNLYVVEDGGAPVKIPNSYCEPGYEHAILAIKQSSGYIQLILNGVQRTVGTISWNGTVSSTLDWTLGGAWQTGSAVRYRLFSGTIKDLRIFDNVEISLSDMFSAVNQVNRFFRTHITAVRSGGINSYQSFDYTCPNRLGWGLRYNNNWNGRD